MKAALDASFKAILLGNLIDVTMACEDAYSKLVEVVNVDNEDRVDNSLVS